MRALIETVRNDPTHAWALGYAEMRLGEMLMLHHEAARTEPLLRDADAVFRKLYSGDSVWRVASMTALGDDLLDQRKSREAVTIFEETCPMQLRLGGPRSSYTIKCRAKLDLSLSQLSAPKLGPKSKATICPSVTKKSPTDGGCVKVVIQ